MRYIKEFSLYETANGIKSSIDIKSPTINQHLSHEGEQNLNAEEVVKKQERPNQGNDHQKLSKRGEDNLPAEEVVKKHARPAQGDKHQKLSKNTKIKSVEQFHEDIQIITRPNDGDEYQRLSDDTEMSDNATEIIKKQSRPEQGDKFQQLSDQEQPKAGEITKKYPRPNQGDDHQNVSDMIEEPKQALTVGEEDDVRDHDDHYHESRITKFSNFK